MEKVPTKGILKKTVPKEPAKLETVIQAQKGEKSEKTSQPMKQKLENEPNNKSKSISETLERKQDSQDEKARNVSINSTCGTQESKSERTACTGSIANSLGRNDSDQ